jgi:hypothetical protein
LNGRVGIGTGGNLVTRVVQKITDRLTNGFFVVNKENPMLIAFEKFAISLDACRQRGFVVVVVVVGVLSEKLIGARPFSKFPRIRSSSVSASPWIHFFFTE